MKKKLEKLLFEYRSTKANLERPAMMLGQLQCCRSTGTCLGSRKGLGGESLGESKELEKEGGEKEDREKDGEKEEGSRKQLRESSGRTKERAGIQVMAAALKEGMSDIASALAGKYTVGNKSEEPVNSFEKLLAGLESTLEKTMAGQDARLDDQLKTIEKIGDRLEESERTNRKLEYMKKIKAFVLCMVHLSVTKKLCYSQYNYMACGFMATQLSLLSIDSFLYDYILFNLYTYKSCAQFLDQFACSRFFGSKSTRRRIGTVIRLTNS